MKKLFVFLGIISIPTFFVVAGSIERVSVDDDGNQGDEISENPNLAGRKISDDGRYVVFQSTASNLVAGDTNGEIDIFVYDRDAGVVERVSVDNLGNEGNFSSINPTISADGRYVVFQSDADNLVAGDTNGTTDIFVYDRNLDTIERVSVDDLGDEGNSLSQNPTISADGRYVSFGSSSDDLVLDDTNGTGDIFVYDRNLNTIERVSVDDLGAEGNSDSATYPIISTDGRYVVFSSASDNLVAGDINGFYDLFLYDRESDSIKRISVDSIGTESDGDSFLASFSSDDEYIVFESHATNLVAGDINGSVDIFLYNVQNETVELVSKNDNGVQGNSDSFNATLSEDGRYVTFASSATNLISGDTNGFNDIFVYDRNTSTIERINLGESDVQANGHSNYPYSTPDGEYVVFQSDASNLVSGDTNGFLDVFVYSKTEEVVIPVPVSRTGTTSGYQSPWARLKDNIYETNNRLVDLTVLTPISVTSYEISNNSDFKNLQKYDRTNLENLYLWDICYGLSDCRFGEKNIYVRFYMYDKLISEKVLFVEYQTDKQCPYFKSYLKREWANDPIEVMKIQEFLNKEMNYNLVVNGVFDKKTENAIRAFQEKYSTQIISPWPGLQGSTGFWYITTRAFANILSGC